MKNDIKKIKQLRNTCSTIKKLFNQQLFFEILCDFSNNNYDEVINNLSLIINYYLTTNDNNYTYPISKLIQLSKETPLTKDFIIHPSHSKYESQYRFQGINTLSIIENSKALELHVLDYLVSFNMTNNYNPNNQICDSLKEAIVLSFETPSVLYNGILKQPKDKELPMVLGATEKSYYRSILDIRLKNIERTYRKTKTKSAKKTINKYIGKNPLLVIIPKTSSTYRIDDNTIQKGNISTHIPSKYLSYIKIPTKYKILSICAKNKGKRVGELLSIKDGTEYTITLPEEKQQYHVFYSNYELIKVTDTFSYTNEELTNDINYDIDLIYGVLDTNKSREQAEKDPISNISFIKRKDDIQVCLINNKYYIKNGRHRILYLKKYYLTHYEEYKRTDKLDELRELVTIPMCVEKTIESKIINEYFTTLKSQNYKIDIFKTNINNNNLEFMIIINNHVYIVKEEQQLKELIELISNNILTNKYLIGLNNKTKINYKELFEYLLLTLKEKLYTMDLIDIIEYLITNRLHQNINYYSLYYEYYNLQQTLQLLKIHNKPINIIDEVQNKQKIKQYKTINTQKYF